MKKILVCLAMSVSMFVVSCSTPAEKSIKELEKIVLEVESGSVDTEKEFEAVLQSVESLNEKYKDVEYTPEQQREVDVLNTRLSAAMTEQFVGQLGRAFSGFMTGMVGGMVSGMNDLVDGMQELVDEIEEVVDDIDDM
jgi:tetrahydromethanopterin S-methyltransferase subunit B